MFTSILTSIETSARHIKKYLCKARAVGPPAGKTYTVVLIIGEFIGLPGGSCSALGLLGGLSRRKSCGATPCGATPESFGEGGY